ncbi:MULTISPECIES: DUF4183 domain-containing protein [Paenibacillus]|uniref:DUF4183 domain-containing protein n=2 Tax=Paenibacillus lactis TaxID=228574 RepID=G4HAV7_9BACL|nr:MULTISPECIES: DUF4183 domain-containing protein [Paenibacillus]EHB67066.1 hypothetical protein PaelaDRAFT_1290 [Paenibacillus lactis 154]MBP1895739.1 hypothetical protein [Paenibacillus lactis]MCM3496870.1 DUF4183 domain-containing protein [Paenibacillus lactis]GIO93698.1 hypothetical protein J31TS3_49250 [Paenibacillus lactis]HAG00592.1 DUF4183 domain-containing protein [Paenibacillus lactis]
MPVIKPVITAIATPPVATGGVVTTTVTPVVSRYFAVVTAAMIGAAATTMPATSFVDDAGAAITAFPALTGTEYVNVYINGMLQQSSLFTLSTADLVLDATDVPEGIPVLLEIASFTNTASAITTQPTISAPTITIIM